MNYLFIAIKTSPAFCKEAVARVRLLVSGGDFRIPLGGLRSGDRSSDEEFRRMSPLRLALATLRSGDRSSEEELCSADLAEVAPVTGL